MEDEQPVQENNVQQIEQQIESTLRSRLPHFKDQADSLTMVSVRRLLEKDLELEEFALDAHRKFIKVALGKLMDSADGSNLNPSTESVKNGADSKKEAAMLPQQEETKKSPKRPGNEDEEMTEDSPIMGVLKQKSEVSSKGSSVSESMIQKAIAKRADHFLANTEVLTLAGVRRLLEEDLGLAKNALDPFKKFISQEIDQVLNTPKEATPSSDVKKKAPVSTKGKKMEKISHREPSESSNSESEKMEDKVKSTKKTVPRTKNKTSEEPKNRKRSKESDLDSSRKKQKVIKRKKEEGSDSDNPGSLSEDDQSQSSARKPAQKVKPASGIGKRVEHLKAIIKACGLSIAPVIYKKAKEVPDNKREDFIVEELEEILSREGLSKNPSEKEIKDCKKRKDTARELEGIDMSNIISSSRRRSTFSFMAPPEPEVRAKAKKIKEKVTENEENDDKESNEEKEDKSEKEKEEKEDEEKGEEDEDEEEEDDEDDDDEAGEDESEEEFNEDDDEESD